MRVRTAGSHKRCVRSSSIVARYCAATHGSWENTRLRCAHGKRLPLGPTLPIEMTRVRAWWDASQYYVEQSFCLANSAAGYKNAHPSRTSDADIARAIETYLPVTPTLSHGMRMDSESWGPDGILQLYFATHLKAALEAQPSRWPVAMSFGLPDDVTIRFRCNEMQQFISVRA